MNFFLRRLNTRKNRVIISLSLVLLVTFAAYFPSLKNSYVNWDDDVYVINNTAIRQLSLHNLKDIFSSFYVCNYHPLTILTYLAEYHFFKLNILAYHITNLILHLLNCLLVFWMIFILSRKIRVSFLAALLFGLHPLHVESVAWISERKDLLYGLFFLSALISYCYYLDKRFSFKYYFLCLLAFILSLLSKSMAITLPLILLFLDWFKARAADRSVITDKLPFLGLSIFFGVIASFGQYLGGAVKPEHLSMVQKILIASYGVIFYITKIIFPVNLSCLYPYLGIKSIFPWVYSLAGLVIILALIASSVKKTKKIIFGSAFFLLAICPVLQFIPITCAIVADRYTYIPALGLFYLASEFAAYIYEKKIKYPRFLKILIISILAAVISLFSGLTWRRCKVWHDTTVLWSDCLSKYPNFALAYKYRGLNYLNQGKIGQAILDYNSAIAIASDYAEAYSNRGMAYQKNGELDQALLDYDRAVRINPNYAEGYNNRGNGYLAKGELLKAISDYQRAIKINPNYYQAYNNLGIAFQNKGDFDRAIFSYDRAIEIYPGYREAYNNRATAYFAIKKYDLSWKDVRRAQDLNFKLDPKFIELLKAATG